MAAVIPEIAETAASAGETAAGAGSAASGPARAGGGARGTRVLPAAPRRQRQGTAPRGGQQSERQHTMKRSRKGRGALKARLPGQHTYQPVILAEFVTAIVIVSVSPVAKGGTAESVAKGSASPYSVNTLKQLVAIGGAYFILALLASSRRAGRYAAWFGGLILLGLGFAQLANGDLTAVFKMFEPGTGKPTPAGALGTNVVSPGVAQDIGNAAATGVPADPTSIFPVIEPGGTGLPSINLQDSGRGTVTNITAPAGTTGVIDNAPTTGSNLA